MVYQTTQQEQSIMSAFVMTIEGFNELANELACRAEDSNRTCDVNYSLTRDVRAFLGLDDYQVAAEETINKAATEAMLALFSANVEAVTYRYSHMSESERGTYAPPTFSRTAYWPKWTSTQLFKHLHCLRYQMSEGNIPESETYKRLERLIAAVADSIVSNSPEYDKAAWDFKPQAIAA
jgi:hypothetical protein